MKKNVFGRQFKRDANERKALFKNLLTSLVLSEKIETSEAKAKAIKGAADKLITKAKKGGVHAYRMLAADVNHNAVVKLVEDLGPRFAARNGGYTRIIKTKRRVADNAAMAVIEWVEKKVEAVTEAKPTKEEKPKPASAKGSGEPKEKKETKKEAKAKEEPKKAKAPEKKAAKGKEAKKEKK